LVPVLRRLGAWWAISGGCSGHEASSFFVDPPLSAFVSLVFSLPFLLGVTVLLLPQHLSLVVSVGCFLYKAGGNSFSVNVNLVPFSFGGDTT
jgi:hypothetical protein